VTAVAALAVLDVLRGFDDRGLHDLLTGLVDQASADPLVQLLALATAAGAGAMHALGPGHGKTVVGGYLASSRGRPRDAVALGALVALMHTGSVLVLGMLFHATSRTAIGPGLDAVLSLVSAGAITAVGVALIRRQLRTRRVRRERAHEPHHHEHRLPEGVAPLSGPGLLALATAGGLLPSPAAFALLVTSLAIGRSGYGLALLAAFSAGLAVTLAAIGLAVVFGRDRLAGRSHRHPVLAALARGVPMAGAAIVLAGGLVMFGVNVGRLV
jgi:nickel/cobalt transporter (NicO) family protein